MKVAIDVHYREDFAKVVSIEFEEWEAEQPTIIKEMLVYDIAPYVSGQFYKRELPCILKILEQTDLSLIDTILIDGYVTLNGGRPGLGRYLYKHLDKSIPIIGIAKKAFRDNENYVRKVVRGESKQPLFITSVGMQLADAAQRIQEMNGKFRMPTLLRILDSRTKS